MNDINENIANVYEKSIIRKYLKLDTYYEILREEWTFQRFILDIVLKTIAIVVVSVNRFIRDACTISASALTFYSILAVIPMIALSLGIAKGFGVSKLLEHEIRSQTFTDPAISEWIINFANNALENSNGGLVTGIGIIVLLWAVIRGLSSIELTMNRIWGVRKGRRVVKKFTDYLSIMFIAPILVILISGVNVYLSSNMQELNDGGGIYMYASSMIIFLINTVPYLLVWLLFLFLYTFMPTTPVKFKYALIASIVAGSVFQIVQWFYIKFQIGVTTYGAVYGSLAAVPLLLVWIQLSWSIILWGTELCYVLRNKHVLYPDNRVKTNEWVSDVDIASDIIKYIADEFMNEKGGPSLEMISDKFKLSTHKLRLVLQKLVDKRIVAEVREDNDVYYYPAMDFHKLSMAYLINNISDVNEGKRSKWKERFIKVIDTEFSGDKFYKE